MSRLSLDCYLPPGWAAYNFFLNNVDEVLLFITEFIKVEFHTYVFIVFVQPFHITKMLNGVGKWRGIRAQTHDPSKTCFDKAAL